MARKNGKKGKNKQPAIDKTIASSLPNKEPKISADIDRYQEEKPVWQVGRIDDGGAWGWKTIGQKRWSQEILPKLQNFETMTWAEIEQASGGRNKGNNNHFIERNKLSKDAQKRLEELNMDDIDQLFSLRLAGKTRVFGKRIGKVMQIMWFDFDHKVCPSSKRNT